MLTGMLKTLRQAETLRYSLNLSGNSLELQLNIDARAGTQLASAWVDSGSMSRLMNYSFSDMPIQYRSRAHNMMGAMDLLQSGLGPIYKKIGLDLDAMGGMVKSFTGEAAGGMNISSDGFTFKTISVLQKETDGQAFLTNTFLPWIASLNKQISNLAAQLPEAPPVPQYERSADSTVAGNKAIGVKIAASPALNNKAIEIRMASKGDLLFMASDDANLASLINGASSLTAASGGPMFRFDVQLGSLIKSSLAGLASAGLPTIDMSNIGNFNMRIDVNMANGKLAAQTNLNVDDLRKLAESMQALMPPDFGMDFDDDADEDDE